MNNRTRSGTTTSAGEVASFLGLIETLGNATQMLFGRVYQSLGIRKNAPPEKNNDPGAILRAMNKELSARVRASETLAARLKSVFATLNEGVVMQDHEGRIVLINNAAENLLGSIRNFWDSELGRLFTEARSHVQTDSEMEIIGEPVRVQLNSKIIGATLAVVSSPEGMPLGTVIMMRDVTKEALADRLKDEFVTAVTHELRTPLTAIKGMSDVLLSQPGDRPPNRKFLEAIGRNAAILDHMIIELLDISEISSGSFAIRKDMIALDELVFDVIKAEEARIAKQKLNVGVMVMNRGRVHAPGDGQRLRWAVAHLLDNALNYTLKGGFITVRIGSAKNDHLLIEVIDSGVGIAEKDLPHVFERFYRGEARTPEGKIIDPRGLGQGLYVARAVAAAHNGYVAVESAVGEGSVFTLALPIAAN
jgi:signal transduction histidine kinase